MSIFKFIRGMKDINRFRQILTVFFEEGFGFLISRLKLGRFVPLTKKIKAKKKEEIPIPVRLRRAFEKLGPTFVKFGQLLSLRPDLLPKEYIVELSKLQDEAPAFPYKEAEKIIKQELGKNVKVLFKDFDKKPIAAASLSQVYKAKLKDGKTVAVKVQRPGVKEIISKDIDILKYIAKLLELYIKEVRPYKPLKAVGEFEKWTKKELDFSIEANNIERFYNNFKDVNTIKIPKVYWGYSSKRVLTTEFIDGIKITDLDKQKGLNKKKIIDNGLDAFYKQVWEDGFFHADLHPGNIFILKGNKISYVDFGIVGYLDEKTRTELGKIFIYLYSKNTSKIVDMLLNMGVVPEKVDLVSLRGEISNLLDQIGAVSIKNLSFGYLFYEINSIFNTYGVRFPVNLILLGKAFMTIEGVGLSLNPNFNIVQYSKKYVDKLAKKKFKVESIKKEMIGTFDDFAEFISGLPERTDRVLKRLEEGRFNIDIEDTDIKRLTVEMERSSTLLTEGLIAAALIVATAYLAQIKTGFILFGVPVFALITFTLAIILILWLIHKTIIMKLGGRSK